MQINCFSPGGCGGTDYNQHLYVNVAKKQWYCHKCGYGDSRQQFGSGSLVRFIADAEKKPFSVIIERLLGTVVPTPDEDLAEYLQRAFNPQPEEVEGPRKIKLSGATKKLRAGTGGPYRDYVFQRGFTDVDLILFDVRYIIRHEFFKKENGKPFEWKWRVVFPIPDIEGKVRSAVGRSITPKQENAWSAWPNADTKDLLWPLGTWDSTSMWRPYSMVKKVVLTEGVFDAHAVNSLTFDFSLCTFGKKISDDQIELLTQLGVEEVVLAWDMDAKEQIKRAVGKLNGRFDVFVFPFEDFGWKEFDFGDVLAKRMEDHVAARKVLINELSRPISTDSLEYCSWILR
jgi:hypothetical protein